MAAAAFPVQLPPRRALAALLGCFGVFSSPIVRTNQAKRSDVTGGTMKGTITACLAELVVKKFGADRWTAILTDAHIDAKTAAVLNVPVSDIDDAVAGRLLESTCRILGISFEQAADAFGDYWCCTYAPRLYKSIVARFRDARHAILSLDQVHVQVTSMMKDSRPPRFDYHWVDEDTLEVTYKSHRKLIQIYIGLARGLGTYFGEHLTVAQIADDRVRIEFAA
jgi:hypothetical protein